MKVENEIQIYEIGGAELPIGQRQDLKVKSHGIRTAFVVLELDGKKVAVVASELERAIKNATNWK